MCEACERFGLVYATPVAGARLRHLTPADAQEATEVIRSAFAAQDYKTDPPSSALKETPESIGKVIAGGGGFGFQCDGGLVALVLFDVLPDALYVRRLSVLPEFLALGLGAKLVEACETAAAARCLRFLEAHVRLALIGNRTFFAKLGFVETGEGRHEGFDAVTFAIARKAVAAD